MPSTNNQHDSKTTTPTAKRRTTRRKKTTTAAAAAVTAAVQADAAPATEPKTFGAWAMFRTAEEAEADAARILCRWTPLASHPGKRRAEWITVAGLPQNRRGLCIDGALGSIARRAVADVVSGATPAAVPVFFSVMAPDGKGEADADNPAHLTVNAEDARKMRGDDEPQPIGFLPSSSIDPKAATAVQAATGVNVSRKTVSGGVAAVGRWAKRWASEDADPEGLRDANNRRARALVLFGSEDKSDKAELRKLLGFARGVNTVANLERKHGPSVIAQGVRRANANPVEAPVKRPVGV